MTDDAPTVQVSGMARYRRLRRIRTAVVTVAVLVVAGAVTLAGRGFVFGGTQRARPATVALPPATATVAKATLTQTERVEGTLGYGAATDIVARASAAAASTAPATTHTITWLPPIGSVVRPGQTAYKVDDRPVVLLDGTTPPYRVLADGAEGADVKQFERNLKAFGYKGFTVDTKYNAGTANAVKAWQKKLGLEQTGTVDVDRIVVAPGEVRVTAYKAAVGAEATGPVLSYTGTTRVVTIPLDVGRQHLVKVGLSAVVTLPDGKSVTGTVASIGTVATAPNAGTGQGGEPGGGQQGSATIEVIVTIADQAALGVLDAAPVSLTLVVNERKDVLTVPVGALVALAEGGYGVQVVEGASTRYVAVKTGMFAGGKVEVSGAGIAEGVTVGVPS